MKFFKIKLYKDKQGQTAVEYLLLLGMLAIILISLMPTIRDRLIGNADCIGADSETILCQMLSFTSLSGGQGNNFRYYTLIR